jgi:hypothetical protein
MTMETAVRELLSIAIIAGVALNVQSSTRASAETCPANVTAAYRALVLKEYDAVLDRRIKELDGKKPALCQAHRLLIKEDRALANLTSKYSCLPTGPDQWNKKAAEAEKLMLEAGCR